MLCWERDWPEAQVVWGGTWSGPARTRTCHLQGLARVSQAPSGGHGGSSLYLGVEGQTASQERACVAQGPCRHPTHQGCEGAAEGGVRLEGEEEDLSEKGLVSSPPESRSLLIQGVTLKLTLGPPHFLHTLSSFPALLSSDYFGPCHVLLPPISKRASPGFLSFPRGCREPGSH